MNNAAEALQRLERPDEKSAFADALLISSIEALKDAAVAAGSQTKATACWKAETIASVQRGFSDAFEMLRVGDFYNAWCRLERCEIDLLNLERHHAPDRDDRHRIQYIARMVVQWQSLFPYAMFLSPEILKKKVICGICGSVVLPRINCGHRKGGIYDGRLCTHQVVEVEFLSISLVTNPVQKYSVAFTSDENGKTLDHYNYGNVKFVADRVISPWHDWRTRKMTRGLTVAEVAHIPLSAPCPCSSGEDFGNCCAGKETVVVPHLQVDFLIPPPADLPSVELLS